MKKGRSIVILLFVILSMAGLAYYSSIILNRTQASLQNVHSAKEVSGNGATEETTDSTEKKGITLGLDLAGGASITYQIADEDATAEEISDTIYKLQKRVETYSTEASVYKQGEDRISVEIPGVTDAGTILADLGTPGSLEFTDPDGNVFMTGEDVVDAQAASYKDQQYGTNEFCVELKLSDSASQTFADMTGDHVGERLSIIYDGNVISSPTVQERIGGGSCQITGMESFEAAENLAAMIRIGSLSLTLNELESQIVGAQMGSEAIKTALTAALIGLAFIMLYLIVMYWVSGVAASFALVIYTTLTVSLIYLFDITLTLPGIAGIILGIGMAVDANVIIFARIKEEIAGGKSIFNAIHDGFQKALSAILDGNITTLIATLVLMWRGSGTVKGFAYTLMISILVSMFTALVVSRFIIYALYGLGFKSEKFYGRAKERKTLGILKSRAIFYIVSVLAIGAGFVGMGVHSSMGERAFNFSLEFVGGTTTTIEFYDDYTIQDIEEKMYPVVESVTGDNEVYGQQVTGSKSIIFKTRLLNQDERDALVTAFSDAGFWFDEETVSSQSVGATVSSEMTRDAIVAVVIAVILMLLYIAFRFADFKFAGAAIMALIHDILVVLTCYALLRISVGTTFIAVMLTILGYSINDTIVTFDRIRENLHGKAKVSKDELEEISNKSVTQTISRSINTSVTTFVMVLLLYVLGVASVKDFALPLMVGVVSGTYSSICLATPLWFELKSRIGVKAASKDNGKSSKAAKSKKK